MEKERKIRTLSLVALVVAVLGLTVAFAALTQTLTIEGTAEVKGAKWSVKFANLSTSNKVGGATVEKETGTETEKTAKIVGDTTIELPKITLTKPGDTVSYTFDVVNDGTIDAKITAIPTYEKTITATASDASVNAADKKLVEDNLIFTLTYENGTEVALNDELLNGGNSKKMKITIGYGDTTSIPTNDVEISNLKVTLTYGQK